ncbi:MAG: NAD(+) synthase [Bacillota bacterium]
MSKSQSDEIRKKAEQRAIGQRSLHLEKWTRRTVSWIKEQVESAGARGTVIGLSGGLDSAVVGELCRRAFPKTSLAVVMPCHSPDEDSRDARSLAEEMGMECTSISLDETFDAMIEVLPEGDPEREGLARANLKPRLRMATLYYIANLHNYLVVGTGNRAEIHLGYFTKYGDGASDIRPLGRLTKAQVCKVAEYLGIPQRIIDRPPSAGLWPGQTDEGELGFTYEEIDAHLLRGSASPEVAERITRMHEMTEHKRTAPPLPPFTLGEGAVPVKVDPGR